MELAFNDNVLRNTDYGGISVRSGDGLSDKIIHAEFLRNKLSMIGMRPDRYGQGHAMDIKFVQTVEVAGNFLDKIWGARIFVYGGKHAKSREDCPLSRILVHHNKVTDALLTTCDWGGIETWQGGPAYVYNNISKNPGGYWNWKHKLNPDEPGNARFGFAYYLDGAFKNYHFNNIAWGKDNDPTGPLGNTSAFQEIHSYQNTFFNNSIWKFQVGSRRQGPQAGRNKYISNIWDGISIRLFRHADVAKQANDADVGDLKKDYALETNAYTGNLFHDVAKMGYFEIEGRQLQTAKDFAAALKERKALESSLGDEVGVGLFRNPDKGDFRLKSDSPAVGQGAKVFVPWSLYAMVGEWNFYPAGDDPTRIIDEHWYMAPYYYDRKTYYKMPMFPLKGVNIAATNYVKGDLEDWVKGALRFNGKDQYAVLSNAALKQAVPKDDAVADKPVNTEVDWVKFEAPERMAPKKRYKIVLELKGNPKPGMLSLNLNMLNTAGKVRFLSWTKPQKIKGAGKYTFTLATKKATNIKNYLLTAFVGPNGDWKDRSAMANWLVPFDTGEAAESGWSSETIRTPGVDKSSFLIEAYFKTEAGAKGGVLMEKMAHSGYSLVIDGKGGIAMNVKSASGGKTVSGKTKVNDGKWHHVVAECDRKNGTLILYVDGKSEATAAGIGAEVSLANSADVYVCGTPQGRCLAATMDFLRISLGTLEDARTTIEEMYAWQFSGPFLQDFAGKTPAAGKRRDAGALQLNP